MFYLVRNRVNPQPSIQSENVQKKKDEAKIFLWGQTFPIFKRINDYVEICQYCQRASHPVFWR